MKKTMEIRLDEGMCSFTEGKMYEIHTRRDLIAYALQANMSVTSDSFKAYQRELVEFTREYELSVENLLETSVRPVLREKGIDLFEYNIDFQKAKAVITYEDSDTSSTDDTEE